jgi:hypothetical protein
MQQASAGTTPFLFGMLPSQRRLPSSKAQVRPITSSNDSSSEHVVGKIEGDALGDFVSLRLALVLDDFEALELFFRRRPCPSVKWQLAATRIHANSRLSFMITSMNVWL